MEEKYIKDLSIGVLANYILEIFLEIGQTITNLLIDNPSFLKLVITIFLIVSFILIINKRKK